MANWRCNLSNWRMRCSVPHLVRIGAPPKRLLLYRTDTPFRKMRSRAFTLPGDKPGDKAHQIEFLCDGQQFVAYGIHPGTGRPYDWPEDSPLDIAAGDLTPITVEQVRAYIEAAEALLIEARGKPAARMAEDTGPRRTNAKLTADYDLIADAIAAVPNRDAHYDDWITVGMALKGAVGGAGQRPVPCLFPEIQQIRCRGHRSHLEQLEAGSYRRRQHLPLGQEIWRMDATSICGVTG